MQIFVEEGRRRPRALWRLLVQLAVFVVVVALLTSFLAAAWFTIGAVALGDAPQAAVDSPALFLIGMISSLIAIFASLWFAGRYLDKRPFRDFGFRLDREWWLDLGFGLFLGAFLMTAIFLIELSFGWVTITGAFETVNPGTPFALAILLPLAVFLCVGVYEEALSRGYQLRNLAEGLNYPLLGPRGAVILAWLLSSLLFGLLHLRNPGASPISTINIALAGILLGAGYVLTGELAIPIGVHITWNFFQGGVYGFPVSGLQSMGATFVSIEQGGPDLWTGGAFGPEAGLLDPIAVLVGSLLIALWVRLRRGEAGIQASISEGPTRREPGSGQTTDKG